MDPVLSPAALCAIIKKSLREGDILKSPHDSIALLAHACMLNTGYTFVGLENAGASNCEISSREISPLPNSWNASSSTVHAFRYTLPTLTNEYRLHVAQVGTRIVLLGSTNDEDKSASLEINMARYTTATNYPWSLGSSVSLADLYISMSRIKEFASLFTAEVATPGNAANAGSDKLRSGEQTTAAAFEQDLPELTRQQPLEGRASETIRPADPSIDRPPPELPRLQYDPLRTAPRPDPLPSDWPPEFEDEHRMSQQSTTTSQGGRRPFDYGADDLRPPGIDAMDPLRSSRPHRGMYPSPDDILLPYAEQGTRNPGGLPGQPPLGARYDPIFPGDPNDPNRLRRGNAGAGNLGPFGGNGLF